MEQHEQKSKRPMGWMNPYWARAGLYVAVVAVSFLVSLLVVRFGCDVLLRAAIPAEPVVWRAVDTVLDLIITVCAAVYFASREGYSKRIASIKKSVMSGLLFLLLRCPVAFWIPVTAGPLATSLAQLVYFGNDSIFASSIDQPPAVLTLIGTAIADLFVLIPAMAVGDHSGAKAYQKEQTAITGKE